MDLVPVMGSCTPVGLIVCFFIGQEKRTESLYIQWDSDSVFENPKNYPVLSLIVVEIVSISTASYVLVGLYFCSFCILLPFVSCFICVHSSCWELVEQGPSLCTLICG